MFGTSPSGGVLYSIWVVEALIIIVAAVAMCLGAIKRNPFCESCESWTEATLISNRLSPIINIEDLVSTLEINNQSQLMKLVEIDPMDKLRTQVQVFSCSNCSNTFYLTVDAISVTIDDKGERDEEETSIVENLILTTQAHNEITAWAKRLKEPKPAVAEATATEDSNDTEEG